MFFDRVHPDDRQLVMDAVRDALATGSVYDIEHRLVLPDGTQKIVHGRSDVIKDERGKPIKMIGTIQDITARKKAREKLLKANEELRTLFENMQEVYFSVDMEELGVFRIHWPPLFPNIWLPECELMQLDVSYRTEV